MEEETGRHAIEAANRSRLRGIIEMPTTVDPPQAGGFRVAPDAGKMKPLIAGIVARRVTRRASVERNRLIWTKPILRDGNDRTTLKAQVQSVGEWGGRLCRRGITQWSVLRHNLRMRYGRA